MLHRTGTELQALPPVPALRNNSLRYSSLEIISGHAMMQDRSAALAQGNFSSQESNSWTARLGLLWMGANVSSPSFLACGGIGV